MALKSPIAALLELDAETFKHWRFEENSLKKKKKPRQLLKKIDNKN